MQVAHQNDFISHAVIGGEATIDFGISSSAEFFNILSSTLYKDQILAVVREVLCNAWDAHIEAGIMDRPVEITMMNNKFTIRDFGSGIHRDDMGTIYGTYGNSTKKNDGKQTGGFGLGCKAPFAYTSHFEVQSMHDGVRTIYNLSKSSAQAQGKPGIVPIASFPCTDSGLQVSIDIHSLIDFNRFMKLIHRIASNGDMCMRLNGQLLGTLGFNRAESNYMITKSTELLDSKHRVMVRYGNVIYPVEETASIHKDYNRVCAHLLKLNVNRNHEEYRIIFQAPPHSISVTPSRESLSMQEHTIATLNALFAGFMKEIDKGFVSHCDAYAINSVKQAVNETRIKDLLSRGARLPTVTDIHVPDSIHDLATMACRFMESNYPSGVEFSKKDIAWRLKGMVDKKLLDRGLVQSYLRELEGVKRLYEPNSRSNPTPVPTQWLQRKVIAPLLVKLQAAGLFVDQFYVYDSLDTRVSSDYYYKNRLPTVLAKNARPGHIFNTLPYFRNIVVISTSTRDVYDRAQQHPVMKELGDSHGFFYYKASMKKLQREKELAFFQTSGMRVIDLTFRQEWEATPTRLASAPRKPGKKGLPQLKGIRLSNGTINIHQAAHPDVVRIENPKFSVNVSLRKENPSCSIDRWNDKASEFIVEMFGADGVITNNSVLHAKAIKGGAKELLVYVHDKVTETLLNSKRIHEHWAFQCNRVMDRYSVYRNVEVSLMKVIYGSKILRDQFGLVNNLTDDESRMIYLWRKLRWIYRHIETPQMKAVTKLLDAIPLDPANKVVVDKLNGSNTLLKVLDIDQLNIMLKKASPKSPEVEKLVNILAIILDK